MSKESNTTKPQLGNIFSGLPLDETKTNTQENETKRKERCCYISIGIILLAVLASTAFVVVHFLVLSTDEKHIKLVDRTSQNTSLQTHQLFFTRQTSNESLVKATTTHTTNPPIDVTTVSRPIRPPRRFETIFCGMCGQWYYPSNGYKYRLSPKVMNFFDGIIYCQNIGGEIAGERLAIEKDLRWNIYGEFLLPLSMKTALIGLRIRGETWSWVGRSPLATPSRLPWLHGEPNNLRGREDCAEVKYKQKNVGFNDVPCVHPNTILCEVKVEQ